MSTEKKLLPGQLSLERALALLAPLLASYQDVARGVVNLVRIQSQRLDMANPYSMRGTLTKAGRAVLIEQVPPARVCAAQVLSADQAALKLTKKRENTALITVALVNEAEGITCLAEEVAEGISLADLLKERRSIEVQEAYLVLAGLDTALSQLDASNLPIAKLRLEDIFLLTGLPREDARCAKLLVSKLNEWPAFNLVVRAHPTLASMAGRGTDIVLGGNVEKPVSLIREDEALSEADRDARIATLREEWKLRHEKVLQAGGLKIIGTERHESRRIDNQLRGRSGRQGDPGESRFYLSLEDPLMKIFAGERLNAIMVRLKMPEGEAIEAGMVTRSLETAQRKVEQRNFDIRKQLLEYDDVSNDQRKVIYQQRNELLESTDISETVTAMREGVLHDLFRIYVPVDSVEEQWDIPALELALESEYQLKIPVGEWVKADPGLTDDDILQRVIEAGAQAYADKHGIAAEVHATPPRRLKLQAYADNFR